MLTLTWASNPPKAIRWPSSDIPTFFPLIVLGIETATSVCSVGVSTNRGVVATAIGPPGRQHAERLLETIDDALVDAGVALGQIEGVAVSAGPGSFTGLRIGMSTAKGIAAAGSLPLTLVSTLAGLAWRLKDHVPVNVCPILDARRDFVYAGVYHAGSEGVEQTWEDRAIHVDALRDVLNAGDGVVLTGEAVRFVNRLQGFEMAPESFSDPDGGAVSVLGRRQLLDGIVADVEGAEPNYCRASQAERERGGSPG